MSEGDKSWWTTMPGLLTALAAIITAVGGLVAALGQTGVFGGKSAVPAASSGPAPVEPVAIRPADPPARPQPAAALPSPAAIKAVRVTTKAGDVVALRPTATILGATIPLKSGQEVPFDRLERIDFTQPWDGTLKLALVGGASMDGAVENLPLSGSNELGDYLKMLSEIRRIEFDR
ncbi:MAG TPA: hypothetical protein VJM48_14190 [Methylibium sp.]|nr:hypothetical protein [Methylibium sp.]